MLGVFSYRGKTYCIKKPLEKGYRPEEVIKFARRDEVKAFFAAASNDPGAWPVIMTIAEWYYPVICRPPANCPEPTAQDFFDALCFQIFSGDLILIEKKPDAGSYESIQNLQLKECCIKEIKKINDTIRCGDVLSAVLIVTPVFKAFFYPPGYDKWASLVSSESSINSENWELFCKATISASIYSRGRAYQIARTHAVFHEQHNDYKLKLFWQGVMHAFE
jgi:hypothetical protein